MSGSVCCVSDGNDEATALTTLVAASQGMEAAAFRTVSENAPVSSRWMRLCKITILEATLRFCAGHYLLTTRADFGVQLLRARTGYSPLENEGRSHAKLVGQLEMDALVGMGMAGSQFHPNRFLHGWRN